MKDISYQDAIMVKCLPKLQLLSIGTFQDGFLEKIQVIHSFCSIFG